MELKKINYGCGESKLEGFINIDCEESIKPDIVCDIRTGPLPFKDNEVSVIYCIHNLEHIELNTGGIFLKSFIEF
mgnify:CR=1 FL=1